MQILSQLQDPSSLPAAYLAEIRDIEGERSPELAEQGLINLSARLERGGDVEHAAELYRILAGQAQTPIADQARDRLQAMNGTSTGTLRWEYLANRFTAQLFDPASLVGMGAAGIAFRGARLFALCRLARSPISPTPRVASWLASAAGLGAEIPSFVLASRLTRQVEGQEVDWSARSLSHDFASTAILLGSLRLSGGAATLLLRPSLRLSTLHSLPWQTQLGIGLGQQTAMLGGMMASRYLESGAGLRSADPDAAVAASESLATLLQFNAAGRVARIAFGPRWAAYERDIDLRSQALHLRPVPTWRNHLRSAMLAPMWLMMGAGGPGGGGAYRSSPRRTAPIGELLQKIGSEQSQVSIGAITQLTLRFPDLEGAEQSRILSGLVRRTGTYDGGLRERLARGLALMRPHLRPEIAPELVREVERVLAASERGQEFQRLLGLGFTPSSVPPLDPSRQIQVAPRVLDYLNDTGTHPQAHGVATHFLRHLLGQPEAVQRDVAVEIVRRGLGQGALGHFYTSLRETGQLHPVFQAWHEEMRARDPGRRFEAVEHLHHLSLSSSGETRSSAVRSIVESLRDPDLQVRNHALVRIRVLEKIFGLPASRRDFLLGFDQYLDRSVQTLQADRASPETFRELIDMPVSIRYRLTQRLLLQENPSRQSQDFVDDCMQESSFIDFVLHPRFNSIRSVEE